MSSQSTLKSSHMELPNCPYCSPQIMYVSIRICTIVFLHDVQQYFVRSTAVWFLEGIGCLGLSCGIIDVKQKQRDLRGLSTRVGKAPHSERSFRLQRTTLASVDPDARGKQFESRLSSLVSQWGKQACCVTLSCQGVALGL